MAENPQTAEDVLNSEFDFDPDAILRELEGDGNGDDSSENSGKGNKSQKAQAYLTVEQCIARYAEFGTVMVDEVFSIHFDKPIERLNLPSNGSTAFQASSALRPGAKFVAYVPNNLYQHRMQNADFIKKIANLKILKLHAYGYKELEKKLTCPYYIYSMPPEKTLAEHVRNLSAKDIIADVLPSLINVINELRSRGITHRQLTLRNIFVQEIKSRKTTVYIVGDCLSTPPGYNNHIIYEVPERLMANKMFRGSGSNYEDLYSVGIMCLLILQGSVPDFSPDEISEHKMIGKVTRNGAYQLLTDKRTLIPDSLSSILRGIVTLDRNSAWRIEDCLRWAESYAFRPDRNSPMSLQHAKKPFVIKKVKYNNIVHLSQALIDNPEIFLSPATAERNYRLIIFWLRQHLRDHKTAQALETLVHIFVQRKSDNFTQLFMSAILTINPLAPIYAYGESFMPDAMTYLIAHVFSGNTTSLTTEDLPKIFSSGIILRNIENNYPYSPYTAKLVGYHRSYNKAADSIQEGGGLEKCLHITSKYLPCFSPTLDGEFVDSLDALLEKLNIVLENPGTDTDIVDNHIITYISSHASDKHKIDKYLKQFIFSKNQLFKEAAIWGIYVSLIKQAQTKSYPNLAKYMLSKYGGIVEYYQNGKRRNHINNQLELLAEAGNIQKMFYTLFSKSNIYQDIRQFKEAKRNSRIYNISTTYEKLDKMELELHSDRISKYVMTSVASIASIGSILGILYSYIF